MLTGRSPQVEMLWESDDPQDALRERFGLHDGATAVEWLGPWLERRWGMSVVGCERIVISAGNALAWLTTTSGPRIAKWSVVTEFFPRLDEIATLTAWLDDACVPVSAPVPASDGALQVEGDGFSMGVQRVRRGDLLDVGDLEQVTAAGRGLAELHLALEAYRPGPHLRMTTPRHPSERITEWLAGADEHVPQLGRDVLAERLSTTPPAPLPTQLVHGDVRSANIMCAGGEVTAFLDLEDARVDHPVVELARASVMLGTRFREWAPVTADVRTALRRGYESRRPLTEAEADWWDTLVLWPSLALIPPGDDPTGWGTEALRVAREHESRAR